MASARSRPVLSPLTLLLLLTTLLACATAAAGFSVRDNGNCGKGHCAEVPGIIPTYKCECDSGWSQVFDFIPISPCIIPNRSFGKDCTAQGLAPSPESPPPPAPSSPAPPGSVPLQSLLQLLLRLSVAMVHVV